MSTIPSDKPASRRRVFAVWRWPRWILVLLLILMPMGYLLSAAPVVYVLRRCGMGRKPQVVTGLMIAYFPLAWLEMKSPEVRSVLEWQMNGLRKTFGEER